MPNQVAHTDSATEPPPWLELVRRQVASLHYGEVQITVHDDRVVQVERRERVRLPTEPRPTAG
ncbi:MAG: YezD family protein [Limisphaerales bacterium]